MAATASSSEEKGQAPSLAKLKKVIKDAFANFDKIGNNTIQADEVGTIMRYLGQFASESELKDTIIPELTDEGGSDGQISFEAFEKMMLRNMSEHVYDPDDGETLLAAFRVLDPEGRGYIDSSFMHENLSTRGGKAVDGFREREMSDFLECAKDKESADPNRIYYEDYVAKLTEDIERHLEHLYMDARGNKMASGTLR
jgi:Ca2+-binding EF-hand superfamily protein